MAVKTSHDTFHTTWFVTFTCYKWIALIELTDSHDLVYNWLKLIAAKKQADTLAFVIMPNHVHMILQLTSEEIHLNTLIGNGKRFMAYEIIKRIESLNKQSLLSLLNRSCSAEEKSKGQKHKVFQPSFDAKPIFTHRFLHQKLDYIHNNSVSGKWNLSDEYVNYPHSSAAFYEMGAKHDLIDIRDFREVF